jgi:arylsulfatase A-like enzyme
MFGDTRRSDHRAQPPFNGIRRVTRQGMAMSRPKVIKDKGGIRHQFRHIIDVVPTILEATGAKAPDMVDGIPQKPIEGVSMMYTFAARNVNAPSTHTTQYFEMMGDHALYHDSWMLSTKVMRPPWDVLGRRLDTQQFDRLAHVQSSGSCTATMSRRAPTSFTRGSTIEAAWRRQCKVCYQSGR